MPRQRNVLVVWCLFALGALVVAATASSTTGRRAAGSNVLVVETRFDTTTTDPSRGNAQSSKVFYRAVYQTLMQYTGKTNNPVPLLASSYTVNKNATRYRFALRHDVRFASGNPFTSADVVFSLLREKYIKDSNSFLMDGINVAADGKYAVVITSATPNSAIPYALGSPFMSILDSKLVIAHGGTDAKNAAKTDRASKWLQSHSAGSGPYQLKSFVLNSEIVMSANPKYWSSPKPAYSEIDMRDVVPSIERLDVVSGRANIALDLTPSQLVGNEQSAGVQVLTNPGPSVFYLSPTADPKVSKEISNPLFWDALRYSLDTKALVQLAGTGARRACGIVAASVVGALPASACIEQNLARVKSDLAKLGNPHPSVTIGYPTNFGVDGMDFGTIAQRVQQQLQQAGFKVTLGGQSFPTWLTAWLNNKLELNQVSDAIPYPAPTAYFDLLPGGNQALRFGWQAGANQKLTSLKKKALATTDRGRLGALARQIQHELNAHGPVIPEIQASRVYLGTKDIAGFNYSMPYEIDLTKIRPA